MKSHKQVLSEHYEQVGLMAWVKAMSVAYPELSLMFAIPNGGRRHIVTGRKMKAEGVQAGVPDLFLPVPKNGQHGLFIEMKSLVGRISPEQKAWLPELQRQGYEVHVCRGWKMAVIVIKDYLGIKGGRHA